MQEISTSVKFWDALKDFIANYNIYVSGFIGFGLLVTVIALVVLFVRLGYYGSNPQKRQETINEILVCFVCLTILGGVTTVYTYALFIVLG